MSNTHNSTSVRLRVGDGSGLPAIIEGISPEVELTEVEAGVRMDVTTKSGTKSALIRNGEPGADYILTEDDKEDIAARFDYIKREAEAAAAAAAESESNAGQSAEDAAASAQAAAASAEAAAGSATAAAGSESSASGYAANASGSASSASSSSAAAAGFASAAESSAQQASNNAVVARTQANTARTQATNAASSATAAANSATAAADSATAAAGSATAASGSATAAAGSATEAAQSATDAQAAATELEDTIQDVADLETEVSNLNSAFDGYQSGNLPMKIIKNSYVINTTGEFSPYNGWDRTDYIPINLYHSIFVKSSVASGYNVFYDKNKSRISDFLVTVNGATRLIPDGAMYVVFSNTAQGMNDLVALYNSSEMIPRHPDGNVTALAAIRDMGVYNIDRSVLLGMADKPNDADDAVATLINHKGAYAGGNFTIQTLYQLSGKTWERVIYTPDGSISKDWYRADTLNVQTRLNLGEVGKVDLGTIFPDVYVDATSGEEIEYAGWSATGFIEITEYIQEGLRLYSPALSTFNVFYNTSKHRISNFKVTAGENEITVPQNAAYFRLSNTTEALGQTIIHGVIHELKTDIDYLKSGNVLQGKKLVTAGDSYTAASWSWSDEYKAYDGKNFGYYIAQRNHMAFVNAGISGSTMAIPTNGQGHNPFVVDRYLNIPDDADYLTIWFGINDAANCTLGAIDDEVDNTFYGAWNKVLRYYLTNRPWLKILIIVTVMANPDIRQATRDVAKKWGYPYLDWEKDVSIPAFFMREGMSDEAKNLRRAAFGYNGPNEGHPNPQWYEYESTIIEAKLRSI